MGKKQKIEWNLQNILIAIGVVWFLIVGLLSAPWVLIKIKRGFLPWIYKDEWGKGWKLFAFRVAYVGAEFVIFYLLLGRSLNYWWSLVFIVAYFGMTYDDRDESEDEDESESEDESEDEK